MSSFISEGTAVWIKKDKNVIAVDYGNEYTENIRWVNRMKVIRPLRRSSQRWLCAVGTATGKAAASGRKAWSDVGTKEYREMAGE